MYHSPSAFLPPGPIHLHHDREKSSCVCVDVCVDMYALYVLGKIKPWRPKLAQRKRKPERKSPVKSPLVRKPGRSMKKEKNERNYHHGLSHPQPIRLTCLFRPRWYYFSLISRSSGVEERKTKGKAGLFLTHRPESSLLGVQRKVLRIYRPHISYCPDRSCVGEQTYPVYLRLDMHADSAMQSTPDPPVTMYKTGTLRT